VSIVSESDGWCGCACAFAGAELEFKLFEVFEFVSVEVEVEFEGGAPDLAVAGEVAEGVDEDGGGSVGGRRAP
jgi:hypothetical protein